MLRFGRSKYLRLTNIVPHQLTPAASVRLARSVIIAVSIRPIRGRRRSSANQSRPINSVVVMTRRIARNGTVVPTSGTAHECSSLISLSLRLVRPAHRLQLSLVLAAPHVSACERTELELVYPKTSTTVTYSHANVTPQRPRLNSGVQVSMQTAVGQLLVPGMVPRAQCLRTFTSTSHRRGLGPQCVQGLEWGSDRPAEGKQWAIRVFGLW